MEKRFVIFLFFNLVLIVIWIGYLFTVQVLDPFNFSQKIKLRSNPSKEIIFPVRGNIIDRKGNTLVAAINFYQMDIDRNVLDRRANNLTIDKEDFYSKVADLIANNSSLQKGFVFNRIKNNPSPFIYISDRITESERIKIVRELSEKRITGVSFVYSKSDRIYTGGNLAARLVGAVSKVRDNSISDSPNRVFFRDEGVTGIEAVFNRELSGQVGWEEQLMDGRNNRIYFPDLNSRPAINGNNIILTIDSDIQEILELNLQNSIDLFSAKNAIGIVMDPKTGEILAMAGINKSDKAQNMRVIRSLPNLAVSFMFEPGSTIKPFTALAALEMNLFKTTDMIDCKTYRFQNRIIRDTHPKDMLSFRDVLVLSSNVGTSKIAEKIGRDSLYNMLVTAGFGNRLNSDFYGESSGILRRVRDWQSFSLHSISFGQEISVTPLQLTTAYSALANNGQLMQPRIVKEIQDSDGKVIRNFNSNLIRVISSQTALDTLKIILKDAVEYGTGSATKLDYLTIAGKTGTAEKALANSSGYSDELYVANFVGFFPVENPQMVISIIIDEPAYRYRYASVSAVKTFKKTVEAIVSLPECKIISNIKEAKSEFVRMPDLMGMEVSRAKRVLDNKGIKYNIQVFNENGKIINQYPKPNVYFNIENQIILIVDKPGELQSHREVDLVMPDLTGMTLRKAINEAKQKYVKLIIKGKGIVYEQSIEPGKKLDFGERCIVKAK